MSHRLFIIAGEPSGDLHGAHLVRALLDQDPALEIACWGGDRMRDAGAKIMKHVDELSFMGFVEVIANLGTILRNFSLAKTQIAAFKPDLVLLIDFPGFNLRMARHIREAGIPVAYYIAPQVWAWKESRVRQIRQYVNHLYVILPFEQPYFEQRGITAEFVGHPLLDELNDQQTTDPSTDFRHSFGLDPLKPVIAILPGSRTQEIERILPVAAEIWRSFPNHQVCVSRVPWQPMQRYERHLPPNIKVVTGRTHELLKCAEAAVVTSGTATLETALLGTPEIVVYRANALSVSIARFLVKVPFISLVNLIMGKEIVPELIQRDARAANIEKALKTILPGGARRDQMLADFEALRQVLGQGGTANVVAKRLLKIMSDRS